MPVLANARYERFAQIVADGKLTPTAAYRETLGADARDPDVNSCRWMKKPPIAERIAELKANAADKCSLSREAYIRSLVEMYEAKPCGRLDGQSEVRRAHHAGPEAGGVPAEAGGRGATLQAGWLGSSDRGAAGGRNELAAFLGRLFAGGGTLGGNNGEVAIMANAARKQAVPQAVAGVDTQQALEAFRDPVWRLSTLLDPHARRVGNQVRPPQQAQIIDLIYRQGCRRIRH